MTNLARVLSTIIATAGIALPSLTMAQPVPVEGTEYVTNEYGDKMPKEIIWQKDGARMVFIPSTTYTQGLPESASIGSPNEKPAREVKLPSFYIDVYEVSNAQYNNFSQATAAPVPRPTGKESLKNPEHPVLGIAWNQASNYATHVGKSLPTEAMWEHAARGPENTLYPTGDELDASAVVAARGLTGETVPVTEDTGDINAFGLYHMTGNVSEFTSDYYDRDAYDEGDVTHPKGPEYGESKVYRGGNYSLEGEELRATARRAIPRPQINDYIGLRTAWIPRKVAQTDATPSPSPLPVISEEQILENLKEEILPYLKAGNLTVPEKMIASKAYVTSGNTTVNFINFTPFRVYITFVAPNLEKVIKYREPLPSMTSRQIELPNEIDLEMLAYSEQGQNKSLFNLGSLRAESQATVVMKTELFSPVVSGNDGSRLFFENGGNARQFYENFSPQWNEVEIYNAFDVPIVVRFDDIVRDPEEPEFVADFTVESKDTLRLTLPPSRYLISADYIGAIENSSEPIELMLDDSAARRLLRLSEAKSGTVVVITEEKPMIELDVREAKLIN